MPARTLEELRRLHFVNALFAQATGNDLYLAEQIKAAIAFSLAELEERTAANPELADIYDAAFNAAATALLVRVFAQHPRRGFVHWNAALHTESATPLFTRAEILARLKKLAGYREATLLVTNLRPALIPANHRATARRRRDYEEALAFIRDLAAARISPHANLQLIFL
jgi:hypothetical protein